MVVDIFSSRLCVLILKSDCRLACAGGSLLGSRASSIYKGIGKLGFQKKFSVTSVSCQLRDGMDCKIIDFNAIIDSDDIVPVETAHQ
jgi:hypothetical protein